MKRFFCLIAFAVTFGFSVDAQISIDNAGGVTVGSNPAKFNAYSYLDVFGNRGSIWQRNFRVTFPGGSALAGSELAGLAEIGGYYTWVALYAKQGAASYAGYFDGYCYVNGNFYFTSDLRLKDNVRNIDNSLQNVIKLKGVKYDFRSDTLSKISSSKVKEFKEKLRKDNLGFIAQDVLKIAPELVITDPASGNYAINYNGFIPMLVEAIKEQQLIVESLQSEIKELKIITGSNTSILKSASTTVSSGTLANSLNALYQNNPNPFSKTTTIEYSIADNMQKALICIYDMNGKQLKCIPLYLNGYGNITINGSELKAGMYMYSLIVDEQLIDTKRMVLTD